MRLDLERLERREGAMNMFTYVEAHPWWTLVYILVIGVFAIEIGLAWRKP